MKTFIRLALVGCSVALGTTAAVYRGLSIETPTPVAYAAQSAGDQPPSRGMIGGAAQAADQPRVASELPPPRPLPMADEVALAAESLPQELPAAPAQPSQVAQVITTTLLKVLDRVSEAAVQRPAASEQAEELPAPASEVDAAEQPVETAAEPAPKPGPSPGQNMVRSPEGAEGDGQLVIDIPPGTEIREVLALLSEHGGLNILAGPNVQGKVSARLTNVDVETALDAILKSTGYVARREGRFIYVGTPRDLEAMALASERLGTRLYRPNYVTAKDLEALITPLLSQTVGKISVTAPAEVGIAADSVNAGGDSYAAPEAVLVQDYEGVLAEIDLVVDEIDKRPAQVAIEAVILSVKLDDSTRFGIDFQVLRDKSHVRLGLGSPRINPLEGGGTVNPVTGGTIGEFNFDGGGLKFAFLDDSLGAFLNAMETIGDTNVIARPQLMCLNKQRAEILIGAQLGYISTTLTETSTAQNVNFLEVGAQLRLRPFIASDGLIRMEVHPELSTGNVRVEGGFTLPDKEVTQVTTNIMVRDGCTVVIGGLMREDLSTSTNQIPFVGSLPVVGPLFRNKTETIERREILVLVTPRIVCEPDTCIEGSGRAEKFLRRQHVYATQMSPLGKRSLGRANLEKARAAWAAGDLPAAIRFADQAVHFDPLNPAAIEFRALLDGTEIHETTEIAVEGEFGPSLGPLEGDEIAPWLLDRLESGEEVPLDPGWPHSGVELGLPGALD